MGVEHTSGVRVKICGMTNREDAMAAAELGADALGFVFAKSPRQVSPDSARTIIDTLPPFVQTVGVFVDEDAGKVAQIVSFCGLDVLQFHGKESPSYCGSFPQKVVKAIRVREDEALGDFNDYGTAVDAFLLDTHVSGRPGGTGKTFDWSVATEAKKHGNIILAGGLNPDNVASAIRAVRPYGVDASSGLEQKPGVKDHDKVARFIRAVRCAGNE
jgi:phosphoribosylanthranilate isomerase